MAWKLISADPNAFDRLSLAGVKEHARVTHDDEDLALDGMLHAAIEHVAEITGRAIIPGTYELVLPACGGTVRFPVTPVREVLSVSYTDRTGAAVPYTGWDFYADNDRPLPPAPQGIAVPDQYFMQRRTMLTTGAAEPLYPTQHRADIYIDMLRDALVIGRLGATVLDNLVGDQDIPKQTGSAVAYWVAEDQPITESDLTFADVSLSPKTVGALTSYSRRTLINAVPGIEDIVRRDLAYVIAAEIDKQALIGDGTANKPVGVVNAAGVHNLTLATPSREQALAMPMAVLTANAAFGNLGWALSPTAAAKLMNTLQVAGDAGGGYIMDAGNIAGYGHALTNALPDGTAIFGAWSQLLVGYWSGTDILVNPYADDAYRRGRVYVRAMRDVDVGVRHGESFAVAEDVVTVTP